MDSLALMELRQKLQVAADSTALQSLSTPNCNYEMPQLCQRCQPYRFGTLGLYDAASLPEAAACPAWLGSSDIRTASLSDKCGGQLCPAND